MIYNYKDITIVYYKNDDETYKAGNIVQGHIEFNLETPRAVKQMYIEIIGECLTHYCTKIVSGSKKSQNFDEKVNYTGNFIIIKDKLIMVNSPRQIPAGFYKQEFIFRLPKDTPSTYSSDNGSITYNIKMVMDLEKSTKSEGAVFPFTVSPSPIDLRYRSDLFEKRWIEIKKNFNGFLRCTKTRDITITANTDKTGYKPGDSIPVRLEVDNWSKVTVNAVKVTLFRKLTYSFDSPVNEKETKLEFIALTQTKSVPKFTCEWFEQVVEVPSNLVVTDFRRSRLIKEEFVILVKASLDGPYFDMEGEIPIELGHFA